MTKLVIARHGNTFAAGETPRRVGARTDMPLTEAGHEQARTIGRYLKDSNLLPAAVFCARLRRTRETARTAMTEAGLALYLQEEEMFDEINYGPDENRTEDEVVARIGKKALRAWDEKAVVPPGWHADPQKITADWLAFGQRIVTDYQGCNVLAVTSNGIARFAPYLTGDFKSFRSKYPLKIATGALCVLEYRQGCWGVREWNLKP